MSGRGPSAGCCSSRTSGSVLRAKLSSRADRGARLAQERRQDLERLGQRLVARGERREGRPRRSSTSPRSCPFSRETAWNDAAGVAHEPPQRHVLVGERPEQVGAGREERRGVAERVVQVGAELAARRRCRTRAAIPRSSAACVGRRCGRPRRAARCRPRWRARACRRRAGFEPRLAGRQLHVGLAEQALLAQDRARVALIGAKRGSISISAGWCGRRGRARLP